MASLDIRKHNVPHLIKHTGMFVEADSHTKELIEYCTVSTITGSMLCRAMFTAVSRAYKFLQRRGHAALKMS